MLYKKKYIAAVSSGPDSMYMLHKYLKNIVAVCHVNYHDREDTNNDEAMIKNFCKTKNLPIYVLDVKNKDYKDIKKNNLQSKYRLLRFNYFEKISKEINIRNIMIAHNLDDHLESAYMQMLSEKKPLFYGLNKTGKYNELNILRPLLNVWKSDIYSLCLKLKINFAFDYSNDNSKFSRNKTRLILSNIDKKDKIYFLNLVKRNNKKNKKINKKIAYIYADWKTNDFNLDYYLSIQNLYKNNVLYMFLAESNIKKINTNKINELNNFIQFGKINSSYRIDLNVFVFKAKSNLKITYNY